MRTIEKLVAEIVRIAGENNPSALRNACSNLIRHLDGEPSTIGTDLARKTLGALRRHRRFDQMQVVAQAIIDDGCNDAQVQRQYAQALIECGARTPAIGILNGVIADPDTTRAEWADAKGVLGRAWKDRALAARGRRDSVAATALKHAYGNYKDVYEQDPTALYQGINRVALAAWDRGLTLSADEAAGALGTANDILKQVEDMPAEKRQAWDFATAAEALIALGRKDESPEWLKNYVAHPDTNAFELGSTVRQLSEVWGLGKTPEGQALLTPLRARLMELPGGSFTVSNHEITQMEAVDQVDYERVLGHVKAKPASWMRQGFELAQSIALFRYEGQGFGTGFIVSGKDLDPRLGDELLVLTNAHVVSDLPEVDAIRPREATVTFELASSKAGPGQTYRISEVIWQSPPSKHDATLLRLTPALPADFKPLIFSDALPVLSETKKQRVYIIGHPGGGELSFSFEDNELLDYEMHLVGADQDPSPCRVHYRTPTERGNSGSPVFDSTWSTIAIHHAGGKEMERLNGKKGSYGANEGIWI